MVISHKYKFIFIKTWKTAGTSIEVYLSQVCANQDILTPISPHVEPHFARNYQGLWNPLPEFLDRGIRVRSTIKDLLKGYKFYNHIPARKVRHRVPRHVWANYFKFCVERNPWDKSLSHFYMARDRMGGKLTFDEYLAKGDLCLNYPKYTDDAGRLMVDRVLRFESLNEELTQVFEKLGVPFSGYLDARAKTEHRKDRRHYRDIYSESQRALVEKAFSREIEMHGYAY